MKTPISSLHVKLLIDRHTENRQTDRQTDRHMNKRGAKHNLLGSGKYRKCRPI